MSLFAFLIVGLIAGWLAGMIMRGGAWGDRRHCRRRDRRRDRRPHFLGAGGLTAATAGSAGFSRRWWER